MSSPMTATARPLRAPRRSPAPAPLRVIPSRLTRSGNGAFAAMCILLLVGGLIALLLLNTALAQGSLILGDLQRESARLDDTAGNLQEEIDRASASGALARSAAALGMVRMNQRGYIDVRSGKVSGDPEPATRLNAFPIVTSPTPPSVTAQVKKVLASATKAAKLEREAATAAAAAGTTATPTVTPTSTGTPSASTASPTPTAGASPSPGGTPTATTDEQPAPTTTR